MIFTTFGTITLLVQRHQRPSKTYSHCNSGIHESFR